LVGNLQVDGHSVTILQDLALVAAGIGPTTPNANFRYVKDTARAVAERLLTSEEWGRVPLAVDQSLWTNGVDSKEKFSSLLNAMWGQDYELTSIFGFFLMWGTYDPLYAVLGRDYMLRTIGLLPPPGNQSRLCFVAPQRHAFEYVWWLFPFFFANAEQVYYLEQQVPRINAATWDTLEALRGQPPPDTTPPVPSVNPLPTITGEGSVTITTPPKATDDVSGTVFGTTSADLSKRPRSW
jgi:hypothetical protein